MTQQPDSRPRPQYGEYADEAQPSSEVRHGDAVRPGDAAQPGNSAQPSPRYGESDPSAASQTSAPAEGTADAATSAAPTSAGHRSSLGPIPGVPHNLGVSADRAAMPMAASGTGTPPAPPATSSPEATAGSRASSTPGAASGAAPRYGEPYRATDVPNARPASFEQQGAATPQQNLHQTPYPAAKQAPQGSRMADRIITIVLLVLGAYSALQFAFSLMTLGASLSELAVGAFKIEDFVVPQSINTLGTVGAIVMLALYAVVLIFSIQRLRARKLAFWAPLAAGAIALILLIAFYSIALSQSPELLQAGMQPEAMQQMLDYVESQGL